MRGGRATGKLVAMDKRLLTATLAATIAIGSAGTALAKPVAYTGKTSGGTTISFKRSGATVSKVGAYLPATCVSSRTSDVRTGADPFMPPGRFALDGVEHTVSAPEQPTSFGMGSTTTKNYHLTLNTGRRGVVKGKLHMNFTAIEPYYNAFGYLDGNTFVCQADATFTARPKR
jgi:hypothetical protein